MTSRIYVGDTGTAIELDCRANISAATALSVEVRKPDGTELSLPSALLGTTQVRAIAPVGGFDQAGDWLVALSDEQLAGLARVEGAAEAPRKTLLAHIGEMQLERAQAKTGKPE